MKSMKSFCFTDSMDGDTCFTSSQSSRIHKSIAQLSVLLITLLKHDSSTSVELHFK